MNYDILKVQAQNVVYLESAEVSNKVWLTPTSKLLAVDPIGPRGANLPGRELVMVQTSSL